jgi:hypothetical protein
MTDLDRLLEGISAYLAGSLITTDEVGDWFVGVGADPEAAATAVGRLAAVRELIAQLTLLNEEPSSALEEPVSPLAQAVHAAPSADAPPPQEAADRTNPDSP